MCNAASKNDVVATDANKTSYRISQSQSKQQTSVHCALAHTAFEPWSKTTKLRRSMTRPNNSGATPQFDSTSIRMVVFLNMLGGRRSVTVCLNVTSACSITSSDVTSSTKNRTITVPPRMRVAPNSQKQSPTCSAVLNSYAHHFTASCLQ